MPLLWRHCVYTGAHDFGGVRRRNQKNRDDCDGEYIEVEPQRLRAEKDEHQGDEERYTPEGLDERDRQESQGQQGAGRRLAQDGQRNAGTEPGSASHHGQRQRIQHSATKKQHRPFSNRGSWVKRLVEC